MYIEVVAASVAVGGSPSTAAVRSYEAGMSFPQNQDSLDRPSFQAMVQV